MGFLLALLAIAVACLLIGVILLIFYCIVVFIVVSIKLLVDKLKKDKDGI